MLLQKIALTLKILFSLNIDINKLQTMKIPNEGKSLALFHINACSLNTNFVDLVHLLSCTNKNFDAIAITETRITKNVSLTNNLTMNNLTMNLLSSPLLNPQQVVPSFILLITYHINLTWM